MQIEDARIGDSKGGRTRHHRYVLLLPVDASFCAVAQVDN